MRELAGNGRATGSVDASRARRPGQARPGARQRRSRAHSDVAHRDAAVGHARRRSRRRNARSCAATCARPTSRSRSPPSSQGRRVDVRALRAQAGGGDARPAAARSTSTAARVHGDGARDAVRSGALRRRCRTAQLDGTIDGARHAVATVRDVTPTSRWPRAAASPASTSAGTARGARHAVDGEGRRGRPVARRLDDRAQAARSARPPTRSRTTSTFRALEQLRPLAVRYAKLALPDPLAGALRARGTVTRRSGKPGRHDRCARRQRCMWGQIVQVATLDVTALDRRRDADPRDRSRWRRAPSSSTSAATRVRAGAGRRSRP